MATLEQITAELDALEARIPVLLAICPPEGEFWVTFSGEADAIED